MTQQLEVCQRGHAMTPDNRKPSGPRWKCRRCTIERDRRYRGHPRVDWWNVDDEEEAL